LSMGIIQDMFMPLNHYLSSSKEEKEQFHMQKYQMLLFSNTEAS